MAFKQWLRSKRIYFETCVTLLVSGAAVVVSYWQYTAGSAQVLIARVSAAPQIHINLTRGKTSDTFFGNENLEFINDGGPAMEVGINIATFLEIQGNLVSVPSPHLKKTVGVNDYFSATMYTGQTKGLLATAIGERNAEKMFKLQEASRKQKSTFESLNIEKVFFAKLSYKDIFNNGYVRYFKIDPITGSKDIPSQSGEKEFAKFHDKTTPLYELGELNGPLLQSR